MKVRVTIVLRNAKTGEIAGRLTAKGRVRGRARATLRARGAKRRFGRARQMSVTMTARSGRAIVGRRSAAVRR